MVTERLQVRLDPEDRLKLEKLAEQEQISVSETVRKLIDRAYEDYMRERRLAAVRRIATANVEDVPEPEELNRQLDEAHSPGDLH
jgi:hypothetical protein